MPRFVAQTMASDREVDFFSRPHPGFQHGFDWWARQDLNLGPTDYESAALTAELRALLLYNILH